MNTALFKRVISLILSAVMVFQLMPVTTSAEELEIEPEIMTEETETDINPSEASMEVVAEVTSLRGENEKHFRMADGSFIAVNYGLPVHYSLDGETWEDIDNTLIATPSRMEGMATMGVNQIPSEYSAVNGDRTVSFSGDLSDGFLFSSTRGQLGVYFALQDDGDTLKSEDLVLEDSNVDINFKEIDDAQTEVTPQDTVSGDTEAVEVTDPRDETLSAGETAMKDETEPTEETTETTNHEEEPQPTEETVVEDETEPTEETTETTNPEEEAQPTDETAVGDETEPREETIQTTNPEDEAQNLIIEVASRETIPATQDSIQATENTEANEDHFAEGATEETVLEEIVTTDSSEADIDPSETEVESESAENAEAETQTSDAGEEFTEAIDQSSSVNITSSGPNVETVSSEIESTSTEVSDFVNETEPSPESTEPTEQTDSTEEIVSLEESILLETEEIPEDSEETGTEEIPSENMQFDRTVVAQISYPDQENSDVGAGDASTMGITQGTTVSDEEPDLMDQIYPEKLRTYILYADVYPGVDILYEMYSVNVKESIIIKKKLDDYTFTFELNLAGLTPVLEDNGGITLVDEDDTVIYRMPAPFMYDDSGVESDSVEYSIKELSDDLWELCVIADEDWINHEERAFPVTIDPTLIEDMSSNLFIYSLTSENTYDVTEKSNIACGYHANSSDGSNYGQIETYFRVSLPEIAPGNTVVRAYVNFNQNDFIPRTEGNSLIVYMSEIAEAVALGSERPDLDGDGDGDMRWSERPDVSELYLDYMTLSWETLDDNIRWDVTSAAKGWYAGEPNYGLAMTSNGNATNQYRAWFTYNSQAAFIVAYRSTIGVEPYYTYQTMDVGNAGTAYIGDFSGNLTMNKQLVYYASAINPISIELNYNSFYPANYNVASAMGYGMNLGYSMKLNLMQKIDEPTIANAATTYLRWTDGDGTQHYFAQNNDGTGYYYDEDGLGLKIKKFSGYYKMYDDEDNVMTFTNGFLTNITDANGNQTIINLNSGKIINVSQRNNTASPQTITVATFVYNASNYLSEIIDAAGNKLLFNYSSGYLVSIKKPNETPGQPDIPIMRYSLPSGVMNFAYDFEAKYGIAFAYNLGMISEYWEINETAEYPNIPGVAGANVVVDHTSSGQVKYRSLGVDQEESDDDVITSYTFDYAGRSVNCYTADADNNIVGATNAVYSGIGNTDKDNNRIMKTASSGSIPQQIYVNGGFEYGGGWTGTGVSRTQDNPRTGLYSLRVAPSSTSTTVRPSISNLVETTGMYTVSAYINTKDATVSGTGVFLEVIAPDGTQAAKTNVVDYKTSSNIENGWIRVSDTFNLETSGSYTVKACISGISGVVYIDDVYLEKSEAPSSVNLIENSGFTYNTVDWNGSTESWTSNGGIHGGALVLTGVAGEEKYSEYSIPINLQGTQTYVLSGWAKGDAVPDSTAIDDKEKSFGLRAEIRYENSSNVESHYVPFNPDVHTWQYASIAVVPEHPELVVETIKVVCAYEKNLNTVYFDDISLVREPAQTMTYDENGELIKISVPNNTNATYTYSGSNLMQAVTEGQGTFNYTYDSNNNLLSAANGILAQTYSYSTKGGLLIGTTLTGSGSKKMTSSATYSSDGNQVLSVTDTRGGVTNYTYESNLYKQYGEPTQVTNALGVAMRSSYFQNGLLFNEYISGLVSMKYAYENNRLAAVIREGWLPGQTGGENKVFQYYNLDYDELGRLDSVSVGEEKITEADAPISLYYLVRNTYDAIGQLEEQTFGNGNSTAYEYDDLGRLKKMIQNDNTETEYFYSSDGKLSMIESDTNTYRYIYDSLDRIIYSDWIHDSSEMVQTYHEYDSSNRITKQSVNILDKNYSEEYTYDTYGRIQKVDFDNNGTASAVSLVYDELSRISNVYHPAAIVAYSYADTDAENVTSALVQKLSYAPRANSLSSIAFEYSYDELGNIETYSDSTGKTRAYVYDDLGQITHEKTSLTGPTLWTYTYDTYGNIRSKANGAELIEFVYGDSEWKDLLTGYKVGNVVHEIEYDGSGNPTTYYNGTEWDFTWENGRELIQARKGSNSTITYDYDMNGLRTSKTVDGVVHNYIYAGGKLMRESYPGTTMDFLYDHNGNPYALIYNGTTYYYILNLQGDVVRLVTTAGTKVADYSYDIWGKCSVSAENSDIGDINPLRYRGYYYDSESGFYYLQSRYYDPQIGRFINADKCLLSQYGFLGYNLFSYCLNNPVNYRDDCGYAPRPTRFDYYAMHKGVQLLIVWEKGYAMEVYVTSPEGIGFLDLYDPYCNQYYEVKASTVNPQKTENQMARYDSSKISSWMFEGYFFIGSLTRGTNSSIEGSFYYKDWLVEYGYVAPGLIMYNYAPNDNAGVTQPFVIPVIIPAGSYSGNPGKNYGNYDYRLI